MDRGERVFLRDTLGKQDRIFEIVAVPRHKRDEHVAAERQFTEFRRRTVGDDVTLANNITHLHQRLLVDAGGLVRTLELHQAININACLRWIEIIGGAHNDTRCIDLINNTRTTGTNRSA